MLEANGKVNGIGEISDPSPFQTLGPIWMPLQIYDYVPPGSRCAKFGRNRCSSFDNMHVFRFHEFGLKTPIHAPKMGFFGGFDPLNGGLSHRDPQKALMVAETRRMSH